MRLVPRDRLDFLDLRQGDPLGRPAQRSQGAASFFKALTDNLDFEVFEPRQFFAAGDNVTVLGRTVARFKSTGKTSTANGRMCLHLGAAKSSDSRSSTIPLRSSMRSPDELKSASNTAPAPFVSFPFHPRRHVDEVQKPDFELQSKNLTLFQGLIQDEGGSYSNWGRHRSTKPAVYAEPITYADVQSVVRDGARFPTPVNPVGSMMSTSSTFMNDGGTLVCLRKLDELIGLERDAADREVVRVQADAGSRS